MNYIGSKKSLLPFIEEVVKDQIGNLKRSIFCDLFSGTGIVARHFRQKVEKIIVNDIEYYSYILNRNYISNWYGVSCDELPLIQEEGFIYNNYCFGSGSKRMYFSDENGKYIDGMRAFINEEKREHIFFLKLCSLLENVDKVANTASVYGSYLKKIKVSASKRIETKIHQPPRGNVGIVYREDANSLIQKIKGDILYLDPPYNRRQYGSNYHLLNTISIYEKFKPKGKTGLPNFLKSEYCSKRRAATVFEDLIKNANFKYIFLSYSDEGIMNLKTIKEIMSKYGKYNLFFKNYKRFKADNKRIKSTDKIVEFIHLLRK